MAGKIIEHFESVPDRQAAEAFSEYSLRMADLKMQHPEYEGDDAFPPAPAWLTGICLSVFRRSK